MRYTIGDNNINFYRGPLDNIGVMFDLPRLPEEDNATYRARLESVFASPGNATYSGLIASITRELGLTIQEAINIECLEPPVSQVSLSNQMLTLYYNGEEEASFFLRDPSFDTIDKLVTGINGSVHFSAERMSDMTGYEPSTGLLGYISQVWVAEEIVPSARIFHLDNAPIIPGSVSFSESKVFYRYSNDLTMPGDFNIDSTSGLIRSVLVPSGKGSVAYLYQSEVNVLTYSPVGLLDLNSQEAREWFFSTVPKDVWTSIKDSVSPAFPHSFMQRIINEIIKNCPATWGA